MTVQLFLATAFALLGAVLLVRPSDLSTRGTVGLVLVVGGCWRPVIVMGWRR